MHNEFNHKGTREFVHMSSAITFFKAEHRGPFFPALVKCLFKLPRFEQYLQYGHLCGAFLVNFGIINRYILRKYKNIARIFQNGQICIESGERGLTGVSRETPKFDGFGDF